MDPAGRCPVAVDDDSGGYATAMEPDTTKPDMHRRILDAIRAIPKGQVAGYGEVARRAGLPGRARLVARLLGQNEDRRLPWHRVLRSDGRIAFPEGSAGWREQSARLRSEGVIVENGRVRGQRAAVTPEEALDAEVWGAPPLATPKAGAGKGRGKATKESAAKPAARTARKPAARR